MKLYKIINRFNLLLLYKYYFIEIVIIYSFVLSNKK